MQKFLPYALLIGAAVAVTWFLKQGQNATALARLVPSFVGVDYKFPATIQVRLKFTNPTNAPAKINALTGALYLNDLHIGNVLVNTVVNVPALGEMVVPVNVQIVVGNIAELVQNIAFMVEGSYNRRADFKLISTVYLDDLTVPLTLKYSL